MRLRHMLYGRPGYPFCLELTADYRLSAAEGLQVSVTAGNAGSRPRPYGTGSHPYLTTGAAVIDECELLLPAARWLRADDRGIPQGQPEDVAGTPYDFRQAAPAGGRPARSRVHRADTRPGRPGLGRAQRRGRADSVLGRPGLPLAAGVHRRHAGPGAPPAGDRDRADDLPAEQLRHRHRPADPAAGRQHHARVGGLRASALTGIVLARADQPGQPVQVGAGVQVVGSCRCRRTPPA